MMNTNTNTATVTGRLDGPLTENHVIMGQTFYTGTILVSRLSGNVDAITITIPGRLLGSLDASTLAGPITVTGQVRSYNKPVDGVGRLVVTLFARDIQKAKTQDTENSITLEGNLCRPPIYRSTPFGREICDVMLAVNRSFGKSDYIPCICWGRNAKWVGLMSVGDHIRANGRLQSRQYDKLLEDGQIVTRTAYEVSIFSVERVLEEGRPGA